MVIKNNVLKIRNILIVSMALVTTACIDETRNIEIFSDGRMTVESEIIVTQKDAGEAVIEILDDMVEDWNSKGWKAGYKVLRKKHPMKLKLNAGGHISKGVGRYVVGAGPLYKLKKKSSTEYELTMSGNEGDGRLRVNFLTSLFSSNATVTDEKNQPVKELDLSEKGRTVKIFLKPSKSKKAKKLTNDKAKRVLQDKKGPVSGVSGNKAKFASQKRNVNNKEAKGKVETALVFDPPSNVRVKPNGGVICSVDSSANLGSGL